MKAPWVAWYLDTVEINGGFLPGLKLKLPRGLICVIGPRGSGKSTLAELLRFAFRGANGAPKSRQDLLQANLGSGGLVTATVVTDGSQHYVVSRPHKQNAIVATDGRQVDSVDVDRGTFLPIDVYNTGEIEAIADEALGEKRRALLDDLCSDELQSIEINLGDQRRSLEANADAIRACRKRLVDLVERTEELAGAASRLAAMPPLEGTKASADFLKSTKQQQTNARESAHVKKLLERIAAQRAALEAVSTAITRPAFTEISEPNSANEKLLQEHSLKIQGMLSTVAGDIVKLVGVLDHVRQSATDAGDVLAQQHVAQAAQLAKLAEKAQAATALVSERAQLEQQVAELNEIGKTLATTKSQLAQLEAERRKLKAAYLSSRESISHLRQRIAEELQSETGPKVRLRVLSNADDLQYKQILQDGLRGARVRNHEEILNGLLTTRPEDLAQWIDRNDASDFDAQMHFGPERASKILSGLRENIDPLSLELTTIDDRIMIELNVAGGSESNFRDAKDLSRGQKCTALLPLLLARRDNPIVVDQPEDNLDNHFIYETIVDAIVRLKANRQMILITHNANIPVLAEADMVIVMNSDGKTGFVEKVGDVDACRNEIIDLLEGGETAFAMRSKRYGKS